MGKGWDTGKAGIAFSPELWNEVYRTLRPGGVVKAFSGTRTFHRMAAAMEEAGLILEPQEDLEAWLYGSGFPKSLNVGNQIDEGSPEAAQWAGWHTALKPSFEPVIVGRKPE